MTEPTSTDEVLIPSPAAQMYAVAFALDVAADHPIPRDVSMLIEQGRGLARGDPLTVPGGRPSVYWFDASASFLRACARHAEPDKARDLIAAAGDLEAARDMAIATMPRPDA
jgi:hypothetical protein